MRSARVFVLLGATIAMLGGGIAQAHVQTVEIKDTAPIFGDQVEVGGLIDCTQGELWTVRVRLHQKDPDTGEDIYQGFGVDRGTCTGSPQRWEVLTEGTSESSPQPGRALATARAFTRLPGSTTMHGDVAKDQEIITLHRAS